MANVKITELTAATALASTDVLPIVDVGADATKKVSVSDLLRNLPDGTASAPALAFADDQNTGVLSPGNNSLAFATSGTQRLVIDSSGNVGVGETTPLGNLHVKSGDSGASSVGASADEFVIEGSANAGMTILSGSSEQGLINFADSSDVNVGSVLYDHGSNFMSFKTNDSERLRIDSSGNVGIGTTSPAERLHVYHPTGNVNAVIESGDANAYLSFKDSSTSSTSHVYLGAAGNDMQFATSTAEKMRLDSSGRLLVGTTSAVTAVPSGESDAPGLQISKANKPTSIALYRNDTSIASGNTLGGIHWYGNDTTSNTPAVLASMQVQADGAHAAGDNPTRITFSTTADAASSPTERMRIDSSGNVGIGTTSPADKLHVVGNGRFNDGVNGAVQLGNIGDNRIAGGSSYGGIRYFTNSNHAWYKASTELMKIDTSGRLLLGHSSSVGDDNNLQVVGSTADASSATFWRSSSDAGNPSINFVKTRGSVASPSIVSSGDILGHIRFNGYDGTDHNGRSAEIKAEVDGTPGTNDMPGRLVFSTSADGSNVPTERMRIDSSGSLGIGTTSPGNRLHVASGSSTQVRYQATNSGSVYTRFQNTDNARGYVGYEAKRLVFYADNGSDTADKKIAVMDADGLKFGSDTAAANALDDYEEGTFTPTAGSPAISGTSPTYAGFYTKIGNQVSVKISVTSTSGDLNVSSYAGINGLPFTSASSGGFATGVITTEDIDLFDRQGFVQSSVNTTSLFVSNCGSSSGTSTLTLTLVYTAA